ncbi:unnamed protein product [Linum tenue]|uniref:Protein kinase domain-containing protein n=1 Tax=Linum tenue TaxID=586396 RepID=A0AAV0LSD3_9ROSI|nr:unnamed protein product [Linum tenue]
MELNEDSRYRGFASNIETSFVRCSGNITIQSYRRVPCLSDDDGLNSVYVSYGTYIISGLKGPCSFLARVPTIYQAVMGPSYENIMLLLQEGFDLGWSVECRDCLARGHECVMTGYDTPFTYECRSPEYYVYGVVSFFAGFLSSVFFDVTLVARFVLAPMVVFGFLIHKYRTTQKSTVTEMVVAKGKFVAVSNSSLVARRYSYADIVAMTDQFRDKIGRGRFGTVFKGKLPDGGLVAVKVLGDPIKLAGEGFVNEINVIARVHHNNVVRLLGVCSEGSHNVLVLDYMPNGSLEGTKFQPLSLEQLLQVALGTARGIRHLHEGCDSCILHMDIKSQNVLLDHGFVPKVTDFGLSKFHRTPRADLRYVAPEVLSNGLGDVLCRSDVYSFGMLLLEMVEGKWLAESKYFPMWVYDHLSEGGDLELQNVTQLESAIARKLCVVGLWCIQKSVSQRPLMAKVVEMLETNGDHLQLPPNSFCFPEHVSAKDLQSDSSRQLLIPESVEPSS